MKIILKFEIQNNTITKNYRSFLLSYFKFTLSEHCHELYKKYYSEKYNVKNFCFSTYMKNAVFGKDEISFKNDFSVTLSVDDASLEGIDWYNAFLKMKNKAFRLPSQNEMVLKNVRIEKERIQNQAQDQDGSALKMKYIIIRVRSDEDASEIDWVV